MLTAKELDSVTAAFKSLESGLRGATIKQEVNNTQNISNSLISMSIYVQSLQKAMLTVGLNPSDQECVDIPNEYAR